MSHVSRSDPSAMIVAVLLLIATSTPYGASPSYDIETATMGGGGGQLAGATLVMDATIGQDVAGAEQTSATIAVEPGYWHSGESPVPVTLQSFTAE